MTGKATKSTVLYIVVGISILAVMVFLGIQIGNLNSVPELNTSKEEKTDQTILPDSRITEIDNIWNLYTNNKLGFTIKIPKNALENNGSCSIGVNEPALVPVTTFDDDRGTFITYEYFYEFSTDSKCKKTVNNYDTILQRADQWKTDQGHKYVPGNWHIVTAEIENETDLDKFVKDSWGEGCQIGEKTNSPTGDIDIKIAGDGLDMENTKCLINFLLAFKYSPKHKIAATWGIGQAPVFNSVDYKNTYDAEIVNSFKFIDRKTN